MWKIFRVWKGYSNNEGSRKYDTDGAAANWRRGYKSLGAGWWVPFWTCGVRTLTYRCLDGGGIFEGPSIEVAVKTTRGGGMVQGEHVEWDQKKTEGRILVWKIKLPWISQCSCKKTQPPGTRGCTQYKDGECLLSLPLHFTFHIPWGYLQSFV